jgi:hypothetical protein
MNDNLLSAITVAITRYIELENSATATGNHADSFLQMSNWKMSRLRKAMQSRNKWRQKLNLRNINKWERK